VADQVLRGVRILDFGRYIAGPFCAALLADFGADVIRIERIGGGEDRFIYPVAEDGGALFLQMNRNKRGMTLDLKSADGRQILERLVAGSDVVVANLPCDTLRDLHLDYESLVQLRPDVILTAVSAFGTEGPYAQRVGFDGIGQAMSGAAHLSGFGQPTKAFASWVDMTSAMLAAFGTMAALHDRSRTGRGQIVQANLFTSALTVMNFALIEQALTGADRQASGNRAQSGAPADCLATRDGWIMIQVIGDALFRRWATLVEQTDWLDDPRFATDALRSDNGAILSERTARWCRDLTSETALALLAEARIPAGPVLSPRQVLQDPHVAAAGLLQDMTYPGAPGPVPLVMKAVGLSETPAGLWRRAPTLGEHTREILAELGYSQPEADAFAAAKVI